MNPKIIFAAVFLPLSALAQPQSHDGPKWMHGLDSSIALNAEQKQKMEDIHLVYHEKMVEERKKQHETMKSLREAERAEMMEVLSPEQQDKLKELRKEKKKEHRELRQELMQYHRSQVAPVLKTYRQQLEMQLSTEEKQSIEKARTMQSELRKNRKSNPQEELTVEDRKAIQDLLKPVIENHKDFFSSMHKELQPKQEIWEKDLQAIREKHGHTSSARKAPKHQAKMKAMQFLLMKP